MTTELTLDEADKIRWDEDPERPLVAIQEVSEHRWYTKRLVAFVDDNPSRMYAGFYWLDPATEMQEGQDEYETVPVKTFQVHGHEKTITVYEPV